MKDDLKKYYPPTTEVIELRFEGVLCDSGEIPDFDAGWELDF